MDKRGRPAIYPDGPARIEVLCSPDLATEIRRHAGSDYGALSRWLREAAEQRIDRERRKEGRQAT